MPNDAKLGLVVGVGLVIAVAVVFFPKDQSSSLPWAVETASSVRAATTSPLVSGGARRPVEAKNATRTEHMVATSRQHTVQEGETLFSLAQRYYGDKDKFIEIYQVNRDVLKSADTLTPGTVLTIPDVSNSPLEAKVEPGP
jgi:nucleoid-associated protein YgaU